MEEVVLMEKQTFDTLSKYEFGTRVLHNMSSKSKKGVETGLCYATDIVMDNGQIVFAEGDVPLGNKKDTIKAYKRVVSIIEADQHTKKQADKEKRILYHIFHEAFNDKKSYLILTSIFLGLASYATLKGNLFALLVGLCGAMSFSNPLNLWRQYKSCIVQQKQREAVLNWVVEKGLGTLLASVENKENIKLYLKFPENPKTKTGNRFGALKAV